MTAPPAEWRKGGSCSQGAHSSFAPSAISRHSALRPSCAIIPRTSHREHRLTILIASHARAHTHTHTQTSRLRWRAVMSQQSATNSAVAVRATRDPSSKRTVLYELAPSNSALDEVCARRGEAGEMGWCSLRTAFDACIVVILCVCICRAWLPRGDAWRRMLAFAPLGCWCKTHQPPQKCTWVYARAYRVPAFRLKSSLGSFSLQDILFFEYGH